MRLSLPAHLFISTLPLIIAQTDLECPTTDLTSYLLQVIDGLYANGLLTFEALLAHITAQDTGYELLSTIFADQEQTYTLLAPTDSAWQMAGIWAPFERQNGAWLVDLFSLHVVKGEVGYDALPEKGHAVWETMMHLGPPSTSGRNSTASEQVAKEAAGEEVGSEAAKRNQKQKIVLKRGEGSGGTSVVVKTAKGDVTSWERPLDLSWLDLVDNLVILPIGNVLELPPDVAKALDLPTSTRSPDGLTQFRAAINNVSMTGTQDLATVTPGGLTLFAPVDDAWSDAARTQANDRELRAKLLGNHYTINQTVFSPSWITNAGPGANRGTRAGLTVMTGQQLLFSAEGETSYVSLGEQKAQILRSDIVLENGAMHIIDKVLLIPDEAPLPTETDINNQIVKTAIVAITEAPMIQPPTTSLPAPAPRPARSTAARVGEMVSTVLLVAVGTIVASFLARV